MAETYNLAQLARLPGDNPAGAGLEPGARVVLPDSAVILQEAYARTGTAFLATKGDGSVAWATLVSSGAGEYVVSWVS
jgi:hypothetical protein